MNVLPTHKAWTGLLHSLPTNDTGSSAPGSTEGRTNVCLSPDPALWGFTPRRSQLPKCKLRTTETRRWDPAWNPTIRKMGGKGAAVGSKLNCTHWKLKLAWVTEPNFVKKATSLRWLPRPATGSDKSRPKAPAYPPVSLGTARTPPPRCDPVSLRMAADGSLADAAKRTHHDGASCSARSRKTEPRRSGRGKSGLRDAPVTQHRTL